MRFRPCIDIHNGKVKQIVGGSLQDAGNQAQENFVSAVDGGYYARLYQENHLPGGHIILLNPKGTAEYEADLEQAKLALSEYPGGLQIGGGITDENCIWFLEQGASHIIVTSYVFQNGQIHWNRIEKLKKLVGKEHLVLDLSCRKKDDSYYIVTDRWQKFTEVKVNKETLEQLEDSCDEFLIHGVDVEGRASGIETDLAAMLGSYVHIPVTYAGGVSSMQDLKQLRLLGQNKVDVTIGSALDLFGGKLSFIQVVAYCREEEQEE